jgi:hypothetical protein
MGEILINVGAILTGAILTGAILTCLHFNLAFRLLILNKNKEKKIKYAENNCRRPYII